MVRIADLRSGHARSFDSGGDDACDINEVIKKFYGLDDVDDDDVGLNPVNISSRRVDMSGNVMYGEL